MIAPRTPIDAATTVAWLSTGQWFSLVLMLVGLTGFLWILRRQARALRPADAPPHRPIDRPAPDADWIPGAIEHRLDRLEHMVRALSEQVGDLERLMRTSAAPAPRTGPAVESKPAWGSGRPPRDEPDTDPVARQVYRLADKGLSPVQIARELGHLTGEVELMLALRAR